MKDLKAEYASRVRPLLFELLEIPSPTGMCNTISNHVKQHLEALGLLVDCKRDGALKTVIAGKDRTVPAAGFMVHLDTLGAQVKRVKENGRLELVPLGTWSARFAEGARTKIHTSDNCLTGTILPAKASGHAFGSEVDELQVDWDNLELRVDAMVSDVDASVQLGVRPGDFVSIDPQPDFLQNGYLVSRFLDDKAAVAALLVAAKELTTDERPPRDIHLMFTVSEEIGTGAPGLVSSVVADLIALDIGIVAPGQAASERGLTICMADGAGPYNRDLSLEMESVCAQASLPVTRDVFRYYESDLAGARLSGTDARMALMTFGVDASHGYERTHIDSLTALTEFLIIYARSPVLQEL